MIAMIMWHVAMPIAPIIKIGLRPTLSTYTTAGIVASHIAIPTTPVAKRAIALLESPRVPKMVGA